MAGNDRRAFVKAILNMKYGVLKEIAMEFANMCKEPDVRGTPKTGNDFAEMLFDWAEAQEDP